MHIKESIENSFEDKGKDLDISKIQSDKNLISASERVFRRKAQLAASVHGAVR